VPKIPSEKESCGAEIENQQTNKQQTITIITPKKNKDPLHTVPLPLP